jgi:predicted O-linked N-acetylglucosamine transferase (SPINDLY family)
MSDTNTADLINQGLALHRQGALPQAAARYSEALRRDPRNPDALYYLAAIAGAEGQFDAAISLSRAAIEVAPDRAKPHNLLGKALHRTRQNPAALASFQAAIACEPTFAEAHGNRANVLIDLGRLSDAVDGFDQALALDPNAIEDWCNRGTALQTLGRSADAIASFARALALVPGFAPAHVGRAGALASLGRNEEALADYDRALAGNAGQAEAWHGRGLVHKQSGRFAQALADLDRALKLKPNDPDILGSRAATLNACRRHAEALACVNSALAAAPQHVDALFVRATVNASLKRYADAVADYDEVLRLKPDHRLAFGGALWCRLSCCDWSRSEGLATVVHHRVVDERSIVSPLAILGTTDDALAQRDGIRAFVEYQRRASGRLRTVGKPAGASRIHVAYLSPDFNDHAVAHLAIELFERHDRTRFEVSALSFAADDRSEMRARLTRAFDRFIDVTERTDREVHQTIEALGIDIAVDLGGYTEGARPFVLADRPAPIQASYLGFAGTSAAEFIDYLIADPVALPPHLHAGFTEKIVSLPDTFMVSQSLRLFASTLTTRAEVGLPDDAFVFCCFNNTWKIAPGTFDVWMRLLAGVDGSILWLKEINELATRNLRQAARSHGVDPDRLVFAPRLPLADHLARHRFADLFLDTQPFNAHTTANDALRAGLPVLTCQGATYAGRVAASQLHAVGLDELITGSLPEYEALALKLARDRQLLDSLRGKLEANAPTMPLFDTDRFRRHIEAAYAEMWAIARRGEPPRSFSVPSLG